MNHNTKRVISAAIAMATAGASHAALAQAAAEGTDDAGDIVVTARRVEERLQDVPISITVLNPVQIANRNIVTAADLATYTPSLSANNRYGADNASFAIRGFTQASGSTPTVSVYFAEVPALRAQSGITLGNGAGAGAYFDLQNVQILKGPQGTLFGRNATGGAILLVPQKPTDRLEGYVEASVGNYDMVRVQGLLNVPFSDTARLRVGFDRQTRKGYLRNRSGIGPKDFNDINYWAVRGSLSVDITPDLENYTVVSYSQSDTNGYIPKVFFCDPLNATALAVLGCAQVARQNARGDGFYDVENSLPNPRQFIRQWQAINTTTWQLNEALTVKNILSYGQFREQFFANVNGDNLIPTTGLDAGKSLARIVVGSYPGADNAAQSTLTEELQFQGRAWGDRLIWQAGGYMELSNPLGYSRQLSPANAVCADENLQNCTSTGVTTASIAGRNSKYYYRDYGLYAQATYKVTDKFGITAGFRYTWNDTRAIARHINFLTLPVTGSPAVGVCLDANTFGKANTGTNVNRTEESCAVNHHVKTEAPTWVIDLEYKPADDILVYAKYARGYHQGSLKTDSPGFETFGPEKVDSYELGVKTTFRGAVSGYLNVAGFYNDLTSQQLNVTMIPSAINPLAPSQFVLNAGKSRIAGVEIEGSVTPVKWFTLDGSYAYLDTKLSSFPVPPPDALVTEYRPAALAGFPLPLSPKHKLTITGTVTLPIDPKIGKLTAALTYTHVAANNAVFNTSLPAALARTNGVDIGRLPAMNLFNLNVNWTSVGDLPLDLSFFATNLTNKKYPTYLFGSFQSNGYDLLTTNEPRMLGVRARVHFGN